MRCALIESHLPEIPEIVLILLQRPFPGWITILLTILLEGGALSSQGEEEGRLWWFFGVDVGDQNCCLRLLYERREGA